MRPKMGLWNQKGADSGSFLFVRMAASYSAWAQWRQFTHSASPLA
jgi:hypothetical protein